MLLTMTTEIMALHVVSNYLSLADVAHCDVAYTNHELRRSFWLPVLALVAFQYGVDVTNDDCCLWLKARCIKPSNVRHLGCQPDVVTDVGLAALAQTSIRQVKCPGGARSLVILDSS
jgi:hypothetical protein